MVKALLQEGRVDILEEKVNPGSKKVRQELLVPPVSVQIEPMGII